MRCENKLFLLVLGITLFLNISLISAQASSSSSTIFEVSYDKPTCIIVNEENKAFFPESFIGQSFWIGSNGTVRDSLLDCMRPDGVNEDGDSGVVQCCPSGYSCIDNECVHGLITRCDEFNTQSECEENNFNELIANEELNDIVSENFTGGCDFWDSYGDFCAEYISCKCEWDTGSNECVSTSNHKVQDLTSGLPLTSWDHTNLPSDIETICNAVVEPRPQGKCTFSFTYTGSCEAGDEFIRRTWIVNWDGIVGDEPAYCVDGSDSISCGDVIKLPFFGFFSLIFSLVIIIIIYIKIENGKWNYIK